MLSTTMPILTTLEACVQGALQVYFSHRNPFFRRALSMPQRLLYVGHAWAFITAAICTPVLMLVPVVTIWGGYFPLVLTW